MHLRTDFKIKIFNLIAKPIPLVIQIVCHNCSYPIYIQCSVFYIIIVRQPRISGVAIQ